MTRADVKELLMMLEALFPNFKVRDLQATLNAWTMILEDEEKEIIGVALKHYCKANNNGFAPNPGQLINIAYDLTHQDDATASEAWTKVYKAIRNGAYNATEEFNKLPPDIQKAVGSAAQIHAWAIDENFNENVISSNFMRAYAQVKARERNDAILPADVKARLDGMTNKMIEGGKANC